MSVENRIKAERSQFRKVVKALLATGKIECYVSYESGYDDDEDINWSTNLTEIMKDQGACDEEHLMVRKIGSDGPSQGYVYFVYGNADDGSEVIADYSNNLSKWVDEVSA